MKGSKMAVFALIAFIVACSGLLYFLNNTENHHKTEAIKVSNLENWSIETSALNGLPLKEDKGIYGPDADASLTSVYITVFPTESDNKTYKFSDFSLHTARNKDYNPELNANIQFAARDNGIGNIRNSDLVNATIRVRGNSSRGATYKSYKVKLKDEAENFNGQKILNINKHMGDASRIANKFCMDLMQSVENVASFRTNFMRVYIKDASLPKNEQKYDYYGLFTNTEQPNKTYLALRGLDNNGSMYKATNFEFRVYPELKNIDDPEYDEDIFETVLGIREAKDHTKLLAMLNDVNDMNQDFNTVFKKYFNEENYLTWMACNILLGNEDTIAHNFILYNPQNSLTWYLLPWDFDGTFKFGKYDSSFSAPIALKGIQRMTGVKLHRRYFSQPGNIEKLTAKMEELLNKNFTEERAKSLIAAYKPVLEETMIQAPDLLIGEIPPDEIDDYIDQFYEQILVNYKNYKESLKYSTPVFVSEPIQNKNGETEFRWEPSNTFDQSFVSYKITLAKDYKFKNIVFEKKDLAETFYIYKENLPAGTYYLKVAAVNDVGLEQYSLDFYYDETDSTPTFGVRQVFIKKD